MENAKEIKEQKNAGDHSSENSNHAIILVDDQAVSVDDAQPTARQLLMVTGNNPAENYTLVQVVDGLPQLIGLDIPIDIDPLGETRFYSFESDRLFRFTLNGREGHWGADSVEVAQLRGITKTPLNEQFYQERTNRPDLELEEEDSIRLKAKGVEQLYTRQAEKICIILNTVKEYVDRGRISFAELTKLAFPDTVITPFIEYTVSFIKGPNNKPEGSLIEGESVKVKKGMVFHVTETDKS